MSLELEKEHAVQQLCALYAKDHLSTGELESRFERVYKAEDRSMLLTVFEGLPVSGALTAPPAPLYELAPMSRTLPSAPNKRMMALFSEIEKNGNWLPGNQLEGTAVFGSIALDLREAQIPVEGIDMELNAYLGSVEVLLPPGVGADINCSAFMSSVTDKTHGGASGAPRIRIHGDLFMGSIEVKTKLPKKAKMESWREQMKAWFSGQ